MATGFFHAAQRAAVWPVAATARFLRRRLAGSAGILVVPVRSGGDAASAQGLLLALRRAATVPGVRVVVLHLQSFPGGWAWGCDLRRVIADLRAAGRRVYAFTEAPGNLELWVASAADEVVVPPSGEVGFVGLAAEPFFAARALEKLGLRADVEAAGAYKAAGEMFTRSAASPENREATSALLHDLQDQLLADVAASRSLDRADVEEARDAAPLGPDEAVEAGLIDRVAYLPDLLEALEEALGDGARQIALRPWLLSDAAAQRLERVGRARRVVVLHLEGGIVMEDETGRPAIRARQACDVLSALGDDDRIEAVVLQITSPGGGAVASDLIWREVRRVAEKKPVVAAFGDVCASGGVYLASGATETMVRPHGITGSIGVVGGKLVAAEGLRRAGVLVDAVGTGPAALMYSPARPFDDLERERFRAMLGRFYTGFVGRVADGLDVEAETIEPHCRGRVWTGRQAHELGLVHGRGDLFDAVDRALALTERPTDGVVRVDLALRPPQPWAQLLTGLARRGPASARVDDVVEALAGADVALWARLLRDQPAQVLAVLPGGLRVR